MTYDDFLGREPSPGDIPISLHWRWLLPWSDCLTGGGNPWDSVKEIPSTKGEAPEETTTTGSICSYWDCLGGFQKLLLFFQILCLYIYEEGFHICMFFFHPLWIVETTTKAASVKLMWPWVWLPGPQVLSKVIWSSTVSLFKIVDCFTAKLSATLTSIFIFIFFKDRKNLYWSR